MILGESVEYWMELQAHAQQLDVDHLIRDLAEANAKVRYYERMFDRVEKYRRVVDRARGEEA